MLLAIADLGSTYAKLLKGERLLQGLLQEAAHQDRVCFKWFFGFRRLGWEAVTVNYSAKQLGVPVGSISMS